MQADVDLREALVLAARRVALSVQEDGLHYLGAELSAATSSRLAMCCEHRLKEDLILDLQWGQSALSRF